MALPNDPVNPYASPASESTAVKTGPRGPVYAPCPSCRSQSAEKVSWTLWGGAMGPWMLNHVRCNQCRTTYNGKTGKSNANAIAIYLVVSGVIGAIAGFLLVKNFIV